jgi:hypothetical protein
MVFLKDDANLLIFDSMFVYLILSTIMLYLSSIILELILVMLFHESLDPAILPNLWITSIYDYPPCLPQNLLVGNVLSLVRTANGGD